VQLDLARDNSAEPRAGAGYAAPGMMVFGDIRAPEKLFRVAGGIVVILVLIPAVLA
jgi:hypothetical protein